MKSRRKCQVCGAKLSEWFLVRGRMWCAYGCGTVSDYAGHNAIRQPLVPAERHDPFDKHSQSASTPPPFRGGQGRSAREIVDSGSYLLCTWCLVIAIALCLVARYVL